ncbi:23S rRNA (cytidine1920-2'-O)/16S rRNA (cytidine1409-2'-O)-methyltransferase [Sedimentibacter acidaminivorans]|jgi:23S rRNA (cytidine1920-2'-O)/16S rRNA (cytidine1409-2'-O)-methyltransferase|uniref:23S rRNA (Cytidine1920-2'-O)/16S rRNA (Cytidine1409-2'-O)-methyltransferase n=1 Tax=Sedimentibacter acidaminivorans TaxID=913099 RepID=A0ABS4GCM8_9FIRM|nr:TlyA family RNA methyltransferase [Sedimentibacter acidaminivorans]MBP1925419.1 23S rRNA (cytidine1920-2'-O)/16S rRNA (cytidine1409-2'-O)-methyltransferase [Sedimentibacter acidaminivorans]
MENKERLDVFLYSQGYTESREKAKQLIINNHTYVDNIMCNKPSTKVSSKSSICIVDDNKYVGRGASKLEKALNYFKIQTSQIVAIDVGASTGGFTDYLLQHGAKKVYAVDVGHDQLHNKLIEDKRVINIENTNFRYIDTEIFIESVDIIVVDVSFISLKLILPKIVEISSDKSDIVVLIKPQFEAGKSNIGKSGIIKDKKIHLVVLNNFNDYCLSNNLYVKNITFSPIKGGNGNIEYLAHIKKGKIAKYDSETFKSLIKEAFDFL